MRNIYVPIKGTFDYSGAEPYGSLVYLAEGRVDPFQLPEFARVCQEKMQGSCEDDFILISGLTSYCIVATSVLIGRLPPICRVVNLLIHKKGQYVREQFTFR